MAIGSISALKQDNLKRLFAFSTIANIGYVMIGLASVNDEAIKASFLYIFIYTLATLGVFSFIMILRREDRQLVTVSDISGLSRSKPLLALSVAILFLASCGSDPKQVAEQTQPEVVKEKPLAEFNIRAIGNTMAEMKYDVVE